MSKKLKFLWICLIFAYRSALAQQNFTIKGIVFKTKTADRVSQVLITNLRSKILMVSDELGGFGIDANTGDTLLFRKKDYEDQKIIVVNANALVVYLQPELTQNLGTVLNDVTIRGQTKKQELSEVMREYRSLGIYNDGNSLPFWQFFNSPVSGIYQLFAKGPKDARRFQKYARNELEYNAVNARYTKNLVKKTTGLDDDGAQKFMETYTPSYEDIKSWNDYQVIMYIKRSYQHYQKNKSEGKLPKLY
jgi:hypothetical protein